VADVGLSDDLDRFRCDVRAWLADHVDDRFAAIGGQLGSVDAHDAFALRVEWEQLLAGAGWIGLAWPEQVGGRGASLAQQVVWAEEYVRSRAPARVNHIGEQLLGPTLIAFGRPEQRQRFLPGILAGTERWCQGYSEPDAGSDLANVRTRAVRDADQWVIHGQKVWTSLAQVAHWCFVLARTDPDSVGHRGLSFLLVPMDQPGIAVRPIVQITGDGEFNEVFFDGARTMADLVVGPEGQGWRTAMGLLGYERGVSTLAMQARFEREFDELAGWAGAHGRLDDPLTRQRLAHSYTHGRVLRWTAERSMAASGVPGPESSVGKLQWGTWHPQLTNLAIDVLGPEGMATGTAPDGRYPLTEQQKAFLHSRADSIYGGSNEIQRNIIGERVLGLPRDPQAGPAPSANREGGRS
jgi:alkylation response protein AidB-like acyl-CoA dehydrogenase